MSIPCTGSYDMIHLLFKNMKGKYNGCHMTIYGSILPGAAAIARSAFLTDKLTERAKYKIKVLDWHKAHGNNLSLTARHFGIGRMTLFRLIKRFKARGVKRISETIRELRSNEEH